MARGGARKAGDADPYVEKTGEIVPSAEKSDLRVEKTGDTDPHAENDVDAEKSGDTILLLDDDRDDADSTVGIQSEVDFGRNAEGTSSGIVVGNLPEEHPEQVLVDKAIVVTSSERPPAIDKAAVNGEVLLTPPGALFDPPFVVPYPGHVLVGGFSVPAHFEALYTAIWKKHGHIATTAKLKSHLALANRVEGALRSIHEMSITTGRTVSDEMIEEWECHRDAFMQYGFNSPWFFKGFSEVQELRKSQDEVPADRIALQREKVGRLVQELKLEQAVLQRMEVSDAQKDELLLKDFP